MKKSFMLIVAFFLVLSSTTNPASAEAIESTLHENFIYTLQPITPDADKLLKSFFAGDTDKLVRIEQNTSKDDKQHYSSQDSGFSLELVPSRGYFMMQKPSEIPTHYRTEGEGMVLPPPSKLPGKYSMEEADEISRKALEQLFEIPIESLTIAKVIHENPEKERSRAYRIFYSYIIDGLKIIPISKSDRSPYIEVRITDDGIVYMGGVSLTVVEKKQIPNDPLSLDEMVKRDPWITSYGKTELAYFLSKNNFGQLITQHVWYTYDDESWFSGNIYDAFTGKEITVE